MASAKYLLAALCAVTLFACASKPVPREPVEPPPDAIVAATAVGSLGQDVETGTPAPVEAPEKEFVVTEEVYQKTFEEIERVIADLNAIIKARDYDGWVGRLAPGYVARTSSAEYLAEASQSAVMKKSGVVLEDLEDYFTYVVVPSRSSVKLDQISFVDATHVKAITVIKGEPYILYWLVREDGTWNIGIW